MTHTTFPSLSTALLSTVLCLTPLACESGSENPAKPGAASTVEESQAPTPEAPPLAKEVPATPSEALTTTPGPLDDGPILATAAAPIPLAETSTPEPAPALERRDRAPDSLRSPTLLPTDTPEEHVAAFTSLPIARHDKAPVGGVGATGIHLDELEVGKGWAKSRCEDLGERFVVGVDERVSVCFRVVHPREDERVSVEWAREGEVRQSIDVSVRPNHAYLTRAWLPVSKGRAGEWTATVKSEDGSVLGRVEFEIESES